MVAGGRSERFGGSVPKQYLDLCGRPVLERAVACVARPGVARVVVVLPAGDLAGPRARSVAALPGVGAVVAGGRTRAASVRAGLAAASDARWVLVHDAARPLARAAMVGRVLEATRVRGAAVPGVPVRDTLKRSASGDEVEGTVERARLIAAQTPQGSRRDWLVEALDAAARDGVEPTDEAAALEAVGRPVAIVAGDAGNLKITDEEDLEVAARILGEGSVDVRVGHGYDCHRFADDERPLVLGGVPFPGERGLLGHSDADVVLHAAMDAVLGAAGLDDIGAWFPPDDPAVAGADSADLAARVCERIGREGWRIGNLDVTVMAERPRVRERVAAMRVAVARAFAIEPGRVGIQATTLEGLGALGRGEGIACAAVALLRRDGDAR